MRSLVLFVVGSALVIGLAGCRTQLGVDDPGVPVARGEAAPATDTLFVRTRADAREVRHAVHQVASDAAPVTWTRTQDGICCPPHCPPPTCCNWNGCGLPCAQGCSDFHVRAVGGYVFAFGDDTDDDGKAYYGGDVGWTSKCCWGIDAFYRRHCAEFDRNFPVIGAAAFQGEDAGQWNHVGVKVTYQSSLGQGRWYWFGGVGPQYFWTEDYLDDDTGWGFFGELGIGYVINKNLRVRVSVEGMGVSTSVGRLNPVDDGSDRWVWFVAPTASLELAL